MPSDTEVREALTRLGRLSPAEPSADLWPRIAQSIGATRARRGWSRRMRWLVELAAAAAIVIALGSWLWTTMRAPYQLEGSARVVDARGEPTKLASGAWIESADTSATLRIRGHARIELSPHTRIRVQGERSPYSVTLDSGQLTCHVQPRSADVEFVTPDGRVAGQGSEATFSLNYSKDEDPMNRKLVVSVLAGVAMLATLDGQTTLAAGEGRETGPAVTAPATQPVHLCPGCRNSANLYPAGNGKCLHCGGATPCVALKLCAACSQKLDWCQGCCNPLRPGEPTCPCRGGRLFPCASCRALMDKKLGPAPQPADQPIVITNADNGETVTVRVGQAIRVELKGDQQNTGWEYSTKDLTAVGWPTPNGEIVMRRDFGGILAFVPDPRFAAVDQNAIGTYVFHLQAVKPGGDKLDFRYIEPGGPNLREARTVTRLRAEFSVTIKVVPADAPTSQPALAPLAAKRLAEVKKFPGAVADIAIFFRADKTGVKDEFHLVGPLCEVMYKAPFRGELTQDEFNRLLDWLAASGVLSDAHDEWLLDKKARPNFPYVEVRVGHYCLYRPLADAMPILNGMKAALPDKPAGALGDFIKRIEKAVPPSATQPAATLDQAKALALRQFVVDNPKYNLGGREIHFADATPKDVRALGWWVMEAPDLARYLIRGQQAIGLPGFKAHHFLVADPFTSGHGDLLYVAQQGSGLLRYEVCLLRADAKAPVVLCTAVCRGLYSELELKPNGQAIEIGAQWLVDGKPVGTVATLTFDKAGKPLVKLAPDLHLPKEVTIEAPAD